jgi:hypothetical protein
MGRKAQRRDIECKRFQPSRWLLLGRRHAFKVMIWPGEIHLRAQHRRGKIIVIWEEKNINEDITWYVSLYDQQNKQTTNQWEDSMQKLPPNSKIRHVRGNYTYSPLSKVCFHVMFREKLWLFLPPASSAVGRSWDHTMIPPKGERNDPTSWAILWSFNG